MLSVVWRMGFVMSLPTIFVILSTIPSLTSIAARQKTFFRICFFLRVAVVCNIWFDNAVVSAGAFSGRSRLRKNASLLDVDGQLVVIERVSDVACQSLHSVRGVFLQLSLKYAVNLCEDHICIFVCVASNLVLVEAYIQHLRQDPDSCLRADAEERAAVHGEI